MRIAFIDHSFHEKTASNMFLRETLQSFGAFDLCLDESWQGGQAPDASAIAHADYHLTVCFQMEHMVPKLIAAGCANIIFVPMWDGCQHLPDEYWRGLSGVRILSFSRTLHEKLVGLGATSAYFQYFPDPSQFEPITDFSTLRGFFWPRRHELTWAAIRRLIHGADFCSFQIHQAVDPGCAPFLAPSKVEIEKYNISLTSWFERREDFEQSLGSANVYFAPRIAEGIGLAFLEAMARGMCVAVPNAPTMNEYVEDRINGLIFDHKKPTSLHFSVAKELGARARESVELGFERWRIDRADRLMQYLLRPQSFPAPVLQTYGAWANARADSALNQATIHTAKTSPRLTIAIVVKNAAATLDGTLRSCIAQDEPDKEIIVIDGASTDKTLDIVQRYGDHVHACVSEADSGPYFAMNRAAELARGEWIIFMNSGDTFYAPDVASRAMRQTPPGADVLFGHNMALAEDGGERFVSAASFEATWEKLLAGNLSAAWIQGVPCHQATFTRTATLRALKFDTSYRIAADHDLLYRLRQQGGRFHHLNDSIAVYRVGGMSMQNHMACIEEWRQIARRFGPTRKIDGFYRRRAQLTNGVSPVNAANSIQHVQKKFAYLWTTRIAAWRRTKVS
ncbi:MAG: glycosyltransferase [Hyphomicrobiales bacterium]|nr:glycosyltransferase [Hyphomicrobiales bacterium]